MCVRILLFCDCVVINEVHDSGYWTPVCFMKYNTFHLLLIHRLIPAYIWWEWSMISLGVITNKQMKLGFRTEKQITYEFDPYVSITYDNFTYGFLFVCNSYVISNYIWVFNVTYEFWP